MIIYQLAYGFVLKIINIQELLLIPVPCHEVSTMGFTIKTLMQNFNLAYLNEKKYMRLFQFLYPENLSGDVGYPVLLQSISFCVLHKVCNRACTTELHNKLQKK